MRASYKTIKASSENTCETKLAQKMKVKKELFQSKTYRARAANCNYIWLTALVLLASVQLMDASAIAALINDTAPYSSEGPPEAPSRTERFLFDSLFGINQPLSDGILDDDDDDEKACDCSKLDNRVYFTLLRSLHTHSSTPRAQRTLTNSAADIRTRKSELWAGGRQV